MDASLVFKLPDWLTETQAVGGLLKCITVALLVQEIHPLRKGEVAVVYAPAGGVGHILCQWATHLGAHVIAVTPSAEKAELARASGAKDVILSEVEDVVARVGECTGGAGANVIYDPVGRESFAASVKALSPEDT